MFLLKATATPESYTAGPTRSLHDAVPLFGGAGRAVARLDAEIAGAAGDGRDGGVLTVVFRQRRRRGVGQRRGGGFERGDACERIVPVRGRGSRAAERGDGVRSEEHTSELQSLMRISYAVFCLKKKNTNTRQPYNH